MKKIGKLMIVFCFVILASCATNNSGVVNTSKETTEEKPDYVVKEFYAVEAEDIYGDKDGTKNIAGVFKGKLNSDTGYLMILYVQSTKNMPFVIFDKNYKDSRMQGSDYSLRYKDDYGKEYSTEMFSVAPGKFFIRNEEYKFIQTLCSSKTVKVFISKAGTASNYCQFTIDTKNFKELYEKYK